MLYHLLYPLHEIFSGFNVFRYITFRAAYASITALLLCFVLGPWIIRKLKERQMNQVIRKDGPTTHLEKAGTPTMGGLIILMSILIPTLLWADLSNYYIGLMIFVTVWMGAIGFLDDYLKVMRKMSKGLVAKYKLLGQFILGLILAFAILHGPYSGTVSITATTVPFMKNMTIDWGYFFVPLVVLMMIWFSNAVNLTDGLDGLAIGLSGIAFAAFAIVCYVTGNSIVSDYLNILYIRGSGELTVYCASVMGAALGFLWFNAKPAKVFMGDVGSLALGASLGAIAILVKKELLLLIIGAVFVVEALSVVIQVAYFKRTKKTGGQGKRIFKMAPLHHHFELCGWSETTVVVRFWICGILAALLSISTFKIQ